MHPRCLEHGRKNATPTAEAAVAGAANSGGWLLKDGIEQKRFFLARRRDRIAVGIEAGFRSRRLRWSTRYRLV
jgi:hypothetical protein